MGEKDYSNPSSVNHLQASDGGNVTPLPDNLSIGHTFRVARPGRGRALISGAAGPGLVFELRSVGIYNLIPGGVRWLLALYRAGVLARSSQSAFPCSC